MADDETDPNGTIWDYNELRPVDGDGDCFPASALVCLLLPLLRKDLIHNFEQMYVWLASPAFPEACQEEVLAAAQALRNYWSQDFDVRALQGDFKPQWLAMTKALRTKCYQAMQNLPKDLISEDLQAILTPMQSESALSTPGKFVPVEWAYGLSAITKKPVYVLLWDNADLHCLAYDASTCAYPPPRRTTEAAAVGDLPADAIVLYFHNFEAPGSHAKAEVDVTAGNCNHFDSVQMAGLGSCPAEWVVSNLLWRSSDAFKLKERTTCGVCRKIREEGFGHACSRCQVNVCANAFDPAQSCCVLADKNNAEGSVVCKVCDTSLPVAVIDLTVIDLTVVHATVGDGTVQEPFVTPVRKQAASRKRKLEETAVDLTDKAARKELTETSAKWRCIEALCRRTGYLCPPGFESNTTWWKDVAKHSTLLPNYDPADRPDFFQCSAIVPDSEESWLQSEKKWIATHLTVATEVFTLAKAHDKLRNWSHDPDLRRRLQKVTIRIKGHTRAHPTMWGEMEVTLTTLIILTLMTLFTLITLIGN